jgi:diguanylate cyclase (GGDEF)-like protein
MGASGIAVEQGGFRMAMIGILDRRSERVVPIASAGIDESLLAAIKDRLSLYKEDSLETTVTTHVIKEKKSFVIRDLKEIQADPLLDKYAESGIGSLAVLPLIVSDQGIGMMVLYAREIDFFHDEEVKLLTELCNNIAFAIDHIEKEEKLNYLAYYDPLTGLANRSLFLKRATEYMRAATAGGHKLALFLIDLERFKNINDSLGHPAGDALLRQVAEWLIHNAGDASLLARVGADQFAIVMPEVKSEGGMTRFLRKKQQAFLGHLFHLNDGVFRITFKSGFALFPDHGDDAETVFKNAEAALNRAKSIGEPFLLYTREITVATAGKLSLENQLRHALDNSEFVLHYQPKGNFLRNTLTGAEALIRWNDPQGQLVPPAHFIPVLEETGLIHQVGRWALSQAIEDYLRWQRAGLPAVRIAVNVSPMQLRDRGFIAEIGDLISIDPQAAAGLELEISESLIMEDVQRSIASLRAIRDLGVTIAIDHFGTGFSSLSYLTKLPVDALKIDRSFITGMNAGPEGLALVSTIIKLAHSLKLTVVAEGVETEDQFRLLRLLDCDEMQGFLVSKAVPADLFAARFLIAAAP